MTLAVDGAGLGIWHWDMVADVIHCNERFLAEMAAALQLVATGLAAAAVIALAEKFKAEQQTQLAIAKADVELRQKAAVAQQQQPYRRVVPYRTPR